MAKAARRAGYEPGQRSCYAGVASGPTTPAFEEQRARVLHRPSRPPWTTTRSAGEDSCFLAKQRSWRTAWRSRSLLRWTSTGTPLGARLALERASRGVNAEAALRLGYTDRFAVRTIRATAMSAAATVNAAAGETSV